MKLFILSMTFQEEKPKNIAQSKHAEVTVFLFSSQVLPFPPNECDRTVRWRRLWRWSVEQIKYCCMMEEITFECVQPLNPFLPLFSLHHNFDFLNTYLTYSSFKLGTQDLIHSILKRFWTLQALGLTLSLSCPPNSSFAYH